MGYEQITTVANANAQEYVNQANDLANVKPDDQQAMSKILTTNRNLGTIGAKDGLVSAINKAVTERLQMAR